jgi:hypothetical protein
LIARIRGKIIELKVMSEFPELDDLLKRSQELHNALLPFLSFPADQAGDRCRASHSICAISFEHAESHRILIGRGNFTSAVGLMRLQYEALVRAIWLFYAATDGFVEKLAAPLNEESARKASNLPMVGEMIDGLASKAPDPAVKIAD